MRRLLLAAAFAAAAGPALAATPPVVNPDPMTVSGRFELPHAAASSPYAGKLKVGAVKVDAAFAAAAKLDAAALQAALGQAAQRSLVNFGYASATDASGASAVDIELLPVSVQAQDGASRVVASLRFSSADACLSRETQGRFKVLARQKSGGGRRAFAIGSAVALAFVGVNAGGLMATEFQTASAQNKALNAGRAVGEGEGVAPGFGAADTAAYGGEQAMQLALADYLRQLGDNCASSGAGQTASSNSATGK